MPEPNSNRPYQRVIVQDSMVPLPIRKNAVLGLIVAKESELGTLVLQDWDLTKSIGYVNGPTKCPVVKPNSKRRKKTLSLLVQRVEPEVFTENIHIHKTVDNTLYALVASQGNMDVLWDQSLKLLKAQRKDNAQIQLTCLNAKIITATSNSMLKN